MNIDFTKEEYRALIELLHLGEKIYLQTCEDSDPHYDDYANVLSKVYSYGEQMGHGELVEVEENGDFGASDELSDKMDDVVMELREMMVTDFMLINQAIDVLQEEIGEEALDAMDDEKRAELIMNKKEELQEPFGFFQN